MGGRERLWGPSVWKQLRSNLAANLLSFSCINLERENGPRRAPDWQTCNHCLWIFTEGLWAIWVRSSLQNTFLILALINKLPMPLCNETLPNVFKCKANHILHRQSSDWGNGRCGKLVFEMRRADGNAFGPSQQLITCGDQTASKLKFCKGCLSSFFVFTQPSSATCSCVIVQTCQMTDRLCLISRGSH